MRSLMRWTMLLAGVGILVIPANGAVIDVDPGEVVVNAGNGLCSIREAIANAESDSDTSSGDCAAGAGSDTVELAAGSTYVLPDSVVAHSDYGNSGLPEIHSTIAINGNGATIERASALYSGTACGGAGAKFRFLYVGPTGNLTLNDLVLQFGCASFGGTGAGGALFNRGTLTIDLTTIRNNGASQSGGAIQNDGTLSLTRSAVSDNATTSGAGGGIVNTATMTILQSTINENETPGAGGGLDNTPGSGSATIANSTLSGNLSSGLGGGVHNRGTATLTNATVALNRGTQFAAAPGIGSGIVEWGGSVSLSNSLVVNQLNGSNCYSLSAGSDNLATDGTCPGATFTATPLLGALADNGGSTFTHALLAGSPAIDTGNNTICGASPVSGVDQRGIVRPRFGTSSSTCDMGAFELAGAANLSITKSASPEVVSAGDLVTYTIEVSNAGPDIATDVVVTDPLPVGLGFVSVTQSQGTCSEVGGTVTCELGTIAASGTATVTLVVQTLAPGEYENTVSGTTTSTDVDGADATSPVVSAAATDVPALDPLSLALLAILLALAGVVITRAR